MLKGWRRGVAPLALAAWVAGGCTSLREIPRGDYAARPERHDVRVEMQDGRVFELDLMKVDADTLVGYRRRDVEGPFDEFGTVRLPLSEVSRLSVRGVDWYRTGLIGGGVLAAVVAAGLSGSKSSSPAPPPSGAGGPGGRVP